MEITTAKLRDLLCACLLFAGVTVHAQTNCVGQPAGLVNWWQAENNAIDTISGHNGTASGSVSYATGEVGKGFAFINGSINFGTNTANFGTSAFTVEFWVKTTAQVSENYQIAMLEKRPACSAVSSFWSLRMGGSGTAGKMHFDMASNSGQDAASLVASRMINDGSWHHVALTRSNGVIALFLDGALDVSQTNATTTVLTNSVGFVAGQSVCSCCDGTQIYSGYLDELSIYSRALSASEILSVYTAGTNGKCAGSPPVITQQPSSLTVQTNSNVGFTVVVSGSAPLSYQWSFDSAAISGATNSTLTLNNVQLTNAGSYSVVVTNAYGSAQSSNAILTVTANGGGGGGSTNCVTIPGLVNWWQGEGNANDSVGTNNGTAASGTSYIGGEVGQSFSFDGTSGEVDMDANTANFRTNDFTVEFWMKTGSSQPAVLMGKRDVCDLGPAWNIMTGYINGQSYPNNIGFEILQSDADYSAAVTTVNIDDNQWHHVALTRAGTNVSMYVDGTVQTSVTVADTTDIDNSSAFIMGRTVCEGPGGIAPYQGNLDEVAIYNRALSASEILSIYSAGGYGKCGGASGTAPVITQQPSSLTAQVGSTVGFTVAATGSAPLSYQWSFNSTAISGATNTSLTIVNVQTTNAGTYSVLVSNPFGSVPSANATLTVGTAPVITQQPVSVTAQTNSTAGFTVGATGTAPLSYQWNFNSAPISGATTSALTIANVQFTNAGAYSVLVSNPFGSVQSSNALLTIAGSGNCTALSGLVNWWQGEGNALDSIGTNNGTLSGGATYGVGESGQGFSLTGSGGVTMDANAGNFRTNDFTVEFWMKTGSTQPAILVGKRSVCNLGPAWNIMMGYINGTSYPGQIGFEFLSSAGDYSAAVTNFAVNDNVWHHIALTRSGTNGSMYVDGLLRTTNSYFPSGTIDFNNTAPLKIGLSPCQGPGGLAPYVGNLDELGIFNRALSASEIQSIYLAGSAGKCASSGTPTIVTQPTNITTAVGMTVSAGVGATGTRPLTYNWIFNGTNVYTTTNSPLVLTNVQYRHAGSYYVVVTNAYGSATSSNAVLTLVPVVRMENAAQTIGPVTVPVRMVANGNENSVSVSVNFPATNLVYASTVLGSNAMNALLTVNTTQAATGKVGLSVFFADASNFGIGTQELARITFRPAIVTNAVTNLLTFGDVPITRQVTDTNANPLLAWYSNAVVTMPVTDYEGDVSPRTNGNHSMTISDWTQAGRFVAGLDVVSNTLEFLRADCAPRTNGGDGRLSIADWVQTGRYAFAFDAIAPIGGPTNFTVAETPKLPTRPVSLVLLSQNGLTNVVAVHLNAQGDENALGFSLSFDPAQLSFVSATLGGGVASAVLNVNSSQAASGHVGAALALSPGNSLAAGDTEVARVTFVSSGFGGSYNAGVGFADQPILREIADANATTESASYSGTTFSATGQPLPTLVATLDSVTNIVLSWPAPSTGFNLESTSPLGTNWTAVIYTPVTNGGNIVVTQAISVDQVFYRLHHP